jgi:hypothetical protein
MSFLLLEASSMYDVYSRNIPYNHNVFIVQATGFDVTKPFSLLVVTLVKKARVFVPDDNFSLA